MIQRDVLGRGKIEIREGVRRKRRGGKVRAVKGLDCNIREGSRLEKGKKQNKKKVR